MIGSFAFVRVFCYVVTRQNYIGNISIYCFFVCRRRIELWCGPQWLVAVQTATFAMCQAPDTSTPCAALPPLFTYWLVDMATSPLKTSGATISVSTFILCICCLLVACICFNTVNLGIWVLPSRCWRLF